MSLCDAQADTLTCFPFQKQVEALEGSIQEKEKLNTLLKAALDGAKAEEKPSVRTADIGIQSHRPEEPAARPEAAALRSVAKARSDSPPKRFPKDRIRSPVRRGLRSHSPKTSSGDLLDSSLDNEMRAAGVDVNDSFDSSEGVGFSDTNLDTSVVESDHSLVIKEEGGDPSSEPHKRPQVTSSSSSSHKTAWTEEGTDQAQAKPNDSCDRLTGPAVNGDGVPSTLGEGLGSEAAASGSGQSEVSADRGKTLVCWLLYCTVYLVS